MMIHQFSFDSSIYYTMMSNSNLLQLQPIYIMKGNFAKKEINSPKLNVAKKTNHKAIVLLSLLE